MLLSVIAKQGGCDRYCPLVCSLCKDKSKAALDMCLSFDGRRNSLQVTELLPVEIESGLEKIRPEEDVQRIETLLSLPRNPSAPDKQSKD